MDEIKWFATLGVGGVLGGIIFFFYRIDRQKSETRLADVVREQQLLNDQLLKVVQENTRAITTLVEAVRWNFLETAPTRPITAARRR